MKSALSSIGVLLVALIGWRCAATDERSRTERPSQDDTAPAPEGGAAGRSLADDDDLPPCAGPGCWHTCPDDAPTRILGTVYNPAKSAPLYNAIVYVPKNPVAPFPDGVTCDQCGAIASGDPWVATTTDAHGRFVLEGAPAGNQIPLVIQIGKWRRVVTIQHVEPCKDNGPLDPELTRLPADRTEGDIPRIAIATGWIDPFECLLQKIGIRTSEFTAPSGPGRVHLYSANGSYAAPLTPASDLYGDLATLMKYDLVILPCEASEIVKEDDAIRNVASYLDSGGRVFATHYSYVWLSKGLAPFASTANWRGAGNEFDVADPLLATVDTSFPKGKALADWLDVVGASSGHGQLKLTQARHNVESANNPPSQAWITATTKRGTPSLQHFTFNTPIDAPDDQQCGRVVYSDFHIVSSGVQYKQIFPQECMYSQSAPTPQEQALSFMLFDLSSCIQKDDEPPIPPIK